MSAQSACSPAALAAAGCRLAGSSFISLLARHLLYTFLGVCTSLERIVSSSLSVIVSPILFSLVGKDVCYIWVPRTCPVLAHVLVGKTEADKQSVKQGGMGQNLKTDRLLEPELTVPLNSAFPCCWWLPEVERAESLLQRAFGLPK